MLSGLKDRLMAPEVAAEAMRTHAEETNLINRERRASGASDRKELADVERRIAAMIAVIEDGGYVRGMVDRLRELEAHQDELKERHSTVPADPQDNHPSIADVYRSKVARLAEALDYPGDRDAAGATIRSLIDRIVLASGNVRGEMDAVLYGDFGTILEWAGGGNGNAGTSTSKMSVSVNAEVKWAKSAEVKWATFFPVTSRSIRRCRSPFLDACDGPCVAVNRRAGSAPWLTA